jgi:hypothetical protein
LGNPTDQNEASAGKEEEPTEAYQQRRKVVATKRNDHTIKTCKTWAKGTPDLKQVIAGGLQEIRLRSHNLLQRLRGHRLLVPSMKKAAP